MAHENEYFMSREDELKKGFPVPIPKPPTQLICPYEITAEDLFQVTGKKWEVVEQYQGCQHWRVITNEKSNG